MKRKNGLFWLLTAVILLGSGLYFLWRTGFFTAIASLESLQAYINDFSPYSQLVFFILQVVSVIFAPIPSNVTAAAGGLLFGMWPAFFLTAMAVTVGSMTVFLLARMLGQPFAERFVSTKVSARYLDLIRRKRDVFLILVFLFPFFPDDLICILAGLTDVSPIKFFFIVLLTRHWGLLVASAIGGSVIAVPIWGMILMGLAGLTLFALGMKYGDQLEEWIVRRFRARS